MKKPTPEEQERRLKLRVAIKVLMYLAALSVVYVVISAIRTGNDEVPQVPTKKVDVSTMNPGEVNFLTWEGRPVLIYKRQGAELAKLREPDTRLKDPNSRNSDQPQSAENPYRSVEADWFVAIASGTDLGCSLEHVPAESELFQDKPWAGGFIDTCRKSRYDLAGRVFESQYATKNLAVPSYAISGQTIILGR